MRFAAILGVILIAIPLLLRFGTADPWPDATSYSAVVQGAQQPLTSGLVGHVPLQLVLIAAAGVFLLVLSLSNRSESFITLLAVSPAFLVTFTTVGPGAIGAILIALGAILIARKQHWAVIFVPMCFYLSTSIGILASMTYIVVAIMSDLPFVALGVSFFALVSSITLAFTNTTHSMGFVNPAYIWKDVLLGEHGGVTIFLVTLGLLGFIVRYRASREPRALLPLILVAFAPLFEHGGIVLAMVLAYTASEAWEYLQKRKWRFEELQSITLVLIACSLLFTMLVTERERATPNTDRVAVRTFAAAGIPPTAHIAATTEIAGALQAEGFITGQPDIPSDSSFIASALVSQGYSYIVTRENNPPYAHFPLVFATASPTTYHVYEVPRR